jgi:hypothetical protein
LFNGEYQKSVVRKTSVHKVTQTDNGNRSKTPSTNEGSLQNNNSVTDQGINVTITGVNFDSNIDGNALKLNFKVTGNKLLLLEADSKAENNATSYFDYLIPNDPTVKQQSYENASIQKGSNNTYNFEIVLNCR